MKPVIAFFFICLSTLLITCTGIISEPIETGVSKTLAMERGKRVTDLDYYLELTVPESKSKKIEGEANITFELTRATAPLLIDFKATNDQLKLVVMNGDTLAPEIRNEHIVLPINSLIDGKNNLEIDFIAGDEALNRNEDYFYALFVPDRARTAIPCFDQPDIKGRFSVMMHIPSKWDGIANGPEEIIQVEDAVKTITFGSSQPISTYLWAFAAGPFKKIEHQWKNQKIGLYHLCDDTVKLNRNIDLIFDQVTQSLDWLEDYTNVTYPFQIYNLVLIPSFQFGGMEHPGATYYREELLLLDETPTRESELGRANLIAHETSHMWFGDLVTMPWFEEVWLKEVFANFMADKITQPWFPDMNHQLRFLLAHFPAAYSVDRTPGANPIDQQLANLKNAGTLYGAIIYHKAPIVMNQLEKLTGEKKLQNGLQEYLKHYAYGNASWDVLIDILNNSSELDLKNWSQTWVYEPGRPVIGFAPSEDKPGTWILKQHPEYNLSGNHAPFWPQKLTVWQDSMLHEQDYFEAQQTTSLPFDTPALIWPADERGYGLMHMTAQQTDYWLTHFLTLKNELLRGRLCINLYENLMDGNIAPDDFAQYLVKGIEEDPEKLLVGLYGRYLSHVYWHLLPESTRAKWSPKLEQQLMSRLQKETDKSLKKTIFNTWLDITETQESLNHITALCNKEEKIKNLKFSEKDRIEMVCQLAVKSSPQATPAMELLMEELKDDNLIHMLAFIQPALSASETARDSFFVSLSDPANRAKEKWVAKALSYLHHPLRTSSSVKYLPKTLQMLEEIQTTGDIFFPIGWLNSSFRGHSSQEALEIATDFLNNHPDYPPHLKLKILQAINPVSRAYTIKRKYL
ncbi:hypothetical protein DMA11_11095 [Marinilabiliaceae bacterium JC017]|nr:hypothetical protein DMA11_11095 [Marinilabiliaceae bacterium JC017]